MRFEIFNLQQLLACLILSGAAKAASPVLERVDFQETPLSEALAFLSAKSVEAGAGGLNFVLIEPAPAVREEGAPVTELVAAPPSVGDREVTFTMSQVPLGKVVQYACEVAKVDVIIEKHAILVGAKADLKAVVDSRRQRQTITPSGGRLASELGGRQIGEVEVDGAPLATTLTYLASQGGDEPVNLIFLGGQDRNVTLKLHDISFGTALRYVTDQTRLGFRIDSRAVVIGPMEMVRAEVKLPKNLPRRLGTNVLAEVSLEDAPLEVVAEFIRAKDEEFEGGDGQPVNVLVSGDFSDRAVTLTLRDAPLIDLIRYAAEQTNCELRFDGFALQFVSR